MDGRSDRIALATFVAYSVLAGGNAVGVRASAVVGAAFLVLLTFVTGNEVALPRQPDTWWAVVYMVVIGSGVVFTLYVVVLKYWDASRANYGFVVVPIVTVLVSAWLLDEHVTVGLIGGGALVLIGVHLGALRQTNTTATHHSRT